MSTANNFMSGGPLPRLPADQQEMQDGLATNAQAATDVANLAVGTRDIARLGVGTTNYASKLFTGKNLINGAMMANRFNVPVLTYTLADYGVREARNAMGYTDNKGLSDLIGDGLGGYVGNKLYGAQNERNSKPFTQEELDAYRANMARNNPASENPVANPVATASLFPSLPTPPVASPVATPEKKMEMEEKFTQAPLDSIMPNIPKRGVGAPEVAPELPNPQELEQASMDPNSLQFAGGGMRPDGIESYSGITASGNRIPIDKEALEAFQKNQESQKSASGLMRQEFDSTPMVSATPEAGMVSFIDNNGKLTYGNETAKQMYSADAIENKLSERFKAEQAPQGTKTPLEAPTEAPEGSTPSGSPEDFPAPAGTPDSEKTQEQLEYEKQIAEDDEGLMKWARDNNKSPEYVEKMMEGIVERREEAQKEKSLKDLFAELQIEKLRLGNKLLEQELGVGSRHEDVDMKDVERLYKMMEDQGVKVDPNTGGMFTLEDNLNPFSDGTQKPLNMFSALFQQLAQTPAGRYILDTPPPEIAIIEDPEVGTYDTEDGRVFSFDGESWSVLTSLGGFNDPLVNDEDEEE
jgi:hypothetical protein